LYLLAVPAGDFNPRLRALYGLQVVGEAVSRRRDIPESFCGQVHRDSEARAGWRKAGDHFPVMMHVEGLSSVMDAVHDVG
jgi:hypothetical protein